MARQFQGAKWFQYETETAEHGLVGAALKTLVGAAIGAAVFFWFSKTLAIIIWVMWPPAE